MKDAKRILKTLGDQQEILVQKKIHIKMIDKAKHLKTLYIVFYENSKLWHQSKESHRGKSGDVWP